MKLLKGIFWGFVLSFIVWGVFCAVCFASATFEIKDNKAIITEVLTNQPVQMMGSNNQTVTIPGTTRDITTKIEVTKEQAKAQAIQIDTQINNLTRNYNVQVTNLRAQKKLLEDIDAALIAVVEEPVE